jgi:hypothetical protein
MTKNKIFLTAQTLGASLVLTSMTFGCSALKNMDDMKNTTQGMANTTNDLDQKTGVVEDKEGSLLNLTGLVQGNAADTYYGLRQGNAAEIRKDMLKAMNKATTVEAKIAYTTIYFEAFEFMLWTGKGKDTQDYLEEQYTQAIQEFDREVTQYIPHDNKLDPTSKDNQMSNLYALAVTMHMQNELEIDQQPLPNDDKTHSEPYKVSMFDLAKSSLVATRLTYEGKLESKNATAWQAEGGAAASLFTYLIQTRENFLPVMTLAKVSTINDDEGVAGKLGFAFAVDLIREGKMLLSQWDSKIPSLNIFQSQQYLTWLDEAIADRDFLKSVGSNASLDGNLLKIYGKMNKPGSSLTEQNPNAGEAKAAQERTAAGDDLWADIQNLLKG